MYFITKEEDLIGKTIAFTHMAQFADALTIVTHDGGVFVVEQNGDSDDKETVVKNAFGIKKYLMDSTNKWILRELNAKEIIKDNEFEEYENEQKRINEEKEKERLKIQKDRERKEYERLKEMFEK